jgi:hypothetical protein
LLFRCESGVDDLKVLLKRIELKFNWLNLNESFQGYFGIDFAVPLCEATVHTELPEKGKPLRKSGTQSHWPKPSFQWKAWQQGRRRHTVASFVDRPDVSIDIPRRFATCRSFINSLSGALSRKCWPLFLFS